MAGWGLKDLRRSLPSRQGTIDRPYWRELMLIRLGYDIQFDIPAPVPMVAMLHVHPSRTADLREPDELQLTPAAPVDLYQDSFGNICSRFVAPAGQLRLYNSTLIEDSGEPDQVNPGARQVPVQDLPSEVLRYLLASRYCEVDQLLNTAGDFSAPPNQDGPAYRRSVTGCTRISHLATTSPVRPRPLGMCLRTAAVSAATSSISQLRFAAA